MEIDQAEREYRWLDAAKAYEQRLQFKPDGAAELWERIGVCYSMASRQTESVEEFRRLRQLAVEAYEKASGLYEKENQGKGLACLASAEYTRSWIAGDVLEKRKMLVKCLEFGRKALEAFKNAGDELNYGKTFSLLSTCLLDRFYVASRDELGRINREAADCASEAVSVLAKLGQKDELSTSLYVAIDMYAELASFGEELLQKSMENKCLSYTKQAIALAEEVSSPYSKAYAMWTGASATGATNLERSFEYAGEMLRQASVVRDNYLMGNALVLLANAKFRLGTLEADPDKKGQLNEEAVKYSEEAIQHLEIVCQDRTIANAYFYIVVVNSARAAEFAVTPSEKARALTRCKKAVEIGEKAREYAIRSGSVHAMFVGWHPLSWAYHCYSKLVPKTEEKLELLKTALRYRKELNKITDSARHLFTRSWGLIFAAEIEADIAMLEEDEKSKARLLEEAISDMETGVEYRRKWVESHPIPWHTTLLANNQNTLGKMLYDHYLLTKDNENLRKANAVYESAAENYKKVDMPSRVAECYWKIARNLDNFGEHQKAAQNFENAFAGYKAAAQRLPQLSAFYLNYATYMKAWSQIETAKEAHRSQKYDTAMQHYETTANLLKSSKLWNYMAPNFLAWSLLEHAEDLSRNENCEESISAFKKAIVFFQQSKQTLQLAMEKIDKEDEKTFVTQLAEATEVREQFSHGRMAIEEAKILDKQGNHTVSSQKYGSAAEIFQKVSQADAEQIGGEAKPLVYLCQAWQKMTLAEAKSSPKMYAEAAGLFKLANEHTSTQAESLLALGHSSFCKALEAGTEFENTRNIAMYSVTSSYMDAAASHYLKAGFESSSEYAKATQRLFDAYVFMDSAKREADLEKQTKYYLMAEKVLQISAEAFAKAGYPAKTDHVQRLLRKVKEEKELALSLSEVFHAPAITSSTASFSTISPTMEKAVGLERFEHADIQAKLVQDKNEIKLGEDLSFNIQIANVGKEPVVLARIENIAPIGFQLVGKPDGSLLEDGRIVVKRKRLDQLKMEEMRFDLRPFRKGTFVIQPRIICVDETGHQMYFEPEPAAIAVLETVLPNRVTTGYEELDNLLLGGIPENYAVVLTSPSIDEKEQLIQKFLEAGVRSAQTTYYLSSEGGNAAWIAEELQSLFYLFICNPKADVMVKSLPNVFKLKGVENLTDLDIALVKSFRMINTSQSVPKRACITILSDVLLQHHVIVTRKWLSGLLADLKSKSFTTLAVINQRMHPQEEIEAILSLFEGEIRITERETAHGLEKVLNVRKMYNQRYLENELTLTRE